MCLEIISSSIISNGIRLNGKYVYRKVEESHTHFVVYDEYSEGLYELVSLHDGEHIMLNTNRQRNIAEKNKYHISLKLTSIGVELFKAIANYDQFRFSFFEDHLDPFSAKGKKIKFSQLVEGVIDYNVLYVVNDVNS